MSHSVPQVAQNEDIGARVRAARSYADLSQQGLADAIGVERRIVGYIEANEERHELTVPEAQAIARATKVPVDFLLNGWGGTDRLAGRIVALEASLRSAHEDQEDLAGRLSELAAAQETRSAGIEKRLAELVRTVDTRLAEFATQVMQQRQKQRRKGDPPGEADQPAP